ncbi:Rab3 GTPase-activating protein catalytic subunit protein [Dioscorea alata]|uniref:Rab3 GTPase-activating protein catalytic subunit protein n=1 Tax=Dioscorea alata TaxID=55571 RepID=A0ACB7UND1_DIOAL|nr:Rab3 GTPase-activating protein catalytic subunit protein [Dioscorea alata]
MEVSISFVSKAKTVLNSAAAKAEKVITEIKADLKRDFEYDGDYFKTETKALDQQQQEASNKATTVLEDDSQVEDNNNLWSTIPASVLRQLASAVECGQTFNSINDIMTSVGHPSPVREKIGLSFSTVKALVLREKDDKSFLDCCGDEEFHSLMPFLFGSGEYMPKRKVSSCLATLPSMYLSREIHSAPPESFVARLSEVIGGFKSLQKMASFWVCVVRELRRLWSEEQPIPHVQLEADPDLNSCLLHQQLQVINCCIARKHRRVLALESLDSVLKETSEGSDMSHNRPVTDHKFYARTFSGDYVLRLGADYPSENLTMLETGEPIYHPVMQEGPILTEELIKENEELVLRTGSVGNGCSQLLSDMQAFKAANPGCVLEDFIRWFSPPDWRESDSENEENIPTGDDSSSRRGRLSRRMQEKGNLWRELWETATPLPAIRQTPLFDEDLAVENILTSLEDIAPSELFEQLFVSVLSSGFLIAEATLPTDGNVSKLLKRCKDYVISSYQAGSTNENLADICEVYQTVEKIMTHPEEAILIMDQPEETKSGEANNRFKKISLNFLSKDRQPLRKVATNDDKLSEGRQSHVFSRLFDKKTSLFSKKHAKAEADASASSSAVPSGEDGSDWTLV